MEKDLSEKISKYKFVLDKTIQLENINATAYQMRHTTSGAKLIYLNTADTENLFSIAFRTPPYDDTGLPHILEHTVLAGSKRYPLKDPFVELLKTSVATFLNAMTYPDKTVYPCASMNEQDFHNIMRVYCDAVFFPKISEEKFGQEGYHYEFSKPKNPHSRLTVKGVVYNEMKGVYSDLNGIIGREETRSLFPDNIYGKDSGGNPDCIKTLSYEDFKSFHTNFYHPSNAYIFVYGSFPIDSTLKILDKEFLSKFNAIDLKIKSNKQPDWATPIFKTIPYPISKNNTTKRKTAITVNFKTNCLTDTLQTLSMSIIETYLLGNSSSPLRRALVDSKIGDSLASSGYGDYQKDTYFTVGLKGTEPDKKDELIKVIFDTCRREIEEGFEARKLEAAFHKLEFAAKEITTSYPINLMDRLYNYWLYDADPFCLFKLDEYLIQLKKLYKEDNRYFEKILKKNILDNPCYSVLTFIPDKLHAEKAIKNFKKEMRAKKKELSAADKKEILDKTNKLNQMHMTPDSPEAIASLPRLKISEISPKPLTIDTEIKQVANRPFLTTELASNGINYITMVFDLCGIDEKLIDYLSIYKLALLRTGTKNVDYLEMAELETLYTGGINTVLHAEGKFDSTATFLPTLSITSKATDNNCGKMLDILWDKIKFCKLDNKKRLYDIIIQQKTALTSSIVSSGSTYAQYYSIKDLNMNHYANDKFNGITHIRFIKNLADNFDKEFDNLVSKLKQIKNVLLNQRRIYFSFIGNKEHQKLTLDWADNLVRSINSYNIPEQTSSFTQCYNTSTGICQPSEVAFNAMSFPSIKATEKEAPALFFIGQYLSYNYLWNKIRMEQGAYGANAFYSELGGFFGFTTYRDPCIEKTYDTFFSTLNHIRKEMKFSKISFEKNIIGSFKKIDRPIRPGGSVHLAMRRYLKNISYEYRCQFRENLLSLTSNALNTSITKILENGFNKASMCTITSRKNLETINNKKKSKIHFDIEYI